MSDDSEGCLALYAEIASGPGAGSRAFRGYRVSAVPPPRFSENTTLGLGGGASEWIVAETEAELIEACAEAENLFILGGGSNIVVADGGFPGTVVQVKTHGIERRKDGEFVTLRVQAGETWDQVVEMSVEKSLAGLECMSGIPGTAGAAPIQNIGAYGPELEEVVAMVKVYDRASGEVLELDCEECEFDYRTSRFKKDDGRYVVLSVDLRLKRQEMSLPITYPELAEALGVSPGGSAPLSTVRSTVLGLRAKRGMVLDPDDRDTYSTGSFFMNPLVSAGHLAEVQLRAEQICGGPVDVPHELEGKDYASLRAGWLIEKAGIPKGYGNPDGVAVSGKHCLALTNRGGGNTTELVGLAEDIASRVKDLWDVTLVPEPVFVGHDWRPLVAI